MNTYLSTTFDRRRRPATSTMRELRHHGVTAVELGSTHEPESGLEQALRTEFADFSLLTHNFFPPPADPSIVINLSDPRQDLRAASVQLAIANVKFAARIGSRLHTVHPGFLATAAPHIGPDRNYDFQFDTASASAPEVAFRWTLDGLAAVGREAARAGITVAVETQGSIEQRDMCLFQTPREMAEFRTAVTSLPMGVSVNLGHLPLAAAAWGFDPVRFIDDVAGQIVAFELSHNDGRRDLHLPLQADGWYWDVIEDARFSAVPMILELRDVDTIDACRHYQILVDRRARAGADA